MEETKRAVSVGHGQEGKGPGITRRTPRRTLAGEDAYWSGPIYDGAWLLKGGRVLVRFRDAGAAGLQVKHSVGFEVKLVAGGHWVQLAIAGWNASALWLDPPSAVSALRYNWYEGACLPLEGPFMCAVYAKAEALPAPPFMVQELRSAPAVAPIASSCRWNLTQPAYYLSGSLPGGSSQYLRGQGRGWLEGDFTSTAFVNVPNACAGSHDLVCGSIPFVACARSFFL